MATQKEIIEALRFVATPYTESLANRIEAEGIAPPDGHIIVPTCAVRKKPYVPMTDDELKKLDDSLESFWHSDSYGVSIGTYCAIKAIEAAVIKRAGLEIKHD